jgi:lipid-binding SYLF domain-containing protein
MMFRLNQVVTLLASFLIAFGSAAQAQDNKQSSQGCGCQAPMVKKQPQGCGCQAPVVKKQPQGCGCQAPVVKKQPQGCGCQAPMVKKQQECPVRYEEAQPAARCIAPRDLPDVYAREAERAADAADVLSTSTAQTMVRGARAVAVIPSVKKGAFIFGGRWGRGLMTMRDEDGVWQPPSYISITGGNFGLQAGFQATDLVLIFTSESAIRSLLRGPLTLNADASAAAGPFGRKLQVGVPILLNSGIYAYSRSRGLFAGISLDGSVISIDNGSNARVYGKGIDGREILLERRVEPNTVVAPFLNAMEMYSPGAGTQQQAQVETTTDDMTTDD